MEDRAEDLLKEEGYKIIKKQARRESFLWVDEKRRDVHFVVSADFLVSKNGMEIPADSKTGDCASIADRDTRRQLLEYAVIYKSKVVLLVNPDTDEITEIRFPELDDV